MCVWINAKKKKRRAGGVKVEEEGETKTNYADIIGQGSSKQLLQLTF
jgi:hypothetical protein